MQAIPIFIFFVGVLIAGGECDPPWWPLLNLAGAALMVLAYLVSRMLEDR